MTKSSRNSRSRNEGKIFEEIIESACQYYSHAGIAEIAKNEEPRQVIGRTGGRNSQMICVNAKKSLPDFTGTLDGGKSIVFEAKHTGKDRIDTSRVTEHQMSLLTRHKKLGAYTFVLVSFRFEHFYKFPIEVWNNAKELFGHKYISESDDISKYKVEFVGNVLKFI